MDFTVGDDNALAANIEDHATALTQLESSAQELHKSLNSMLDYQTHHRLVNITFLAVNSFRTKNLKIKLQFQREAQGRKRAEELNERVLWWSIAEAFAILAISITQVLVLRNFFTDKAPNQSRYGRL